MSKGIELSAHTPHHDSSISSTHAKLSGASHEATSACCSECSGTGIVRHWSEFAFFEDMRACSQCDAGDKIEALIGEIMKRAQR
jgi:DnaJ-class molecular chaperone